MGIQSSRLTKPVIQIVAFCLLGIYLFRKTSSLFLGRIFGGYADQIFCYSLKCMILSIQPVSLFCRFSAYEDNVRNINFLDSGRDLQDDFSIYAPKNYTLPSLISILKYCHIRVTLVTIATHLRLYSALK